MQTHHLFQCARVLAFSCLMFLLASGDVRAFQKPPQPDYTIPVEFTIRIQSKKKKPIKTARTFDNTIVQVHDVLNDPTSIFLKGIGEGTALVELISADPDEDPEQLFIYVIRQQSPATNLKHLKDATFDLEHLKKMLANAFPKTPMVVTPITTDSVYINGEVASAADLVSALQMASKIIDPRYMEKADQQKAGTYDLEMDGKKLVTVSSKVINGLRVRGGQAEPEPQPQKGAPPRTTFDVDYLKKVISKVVPDANLNVIPVTKDAVMISGYVSRAEDVVMVMSVATNVVDPAFFDSQALSTYQTPAAPGTTGQAPGNQPANAPAQATPNAQNTNRNSSPKVINAIRVAGSQQVQLDVVVAQVSRSEFRQLGFNFLASRNSSFIGSTLGGLAGGPNFLNAASASSTGSSLAANGFINSVTTANVPFGVLNSSSGFLGFLQALRTENASKLLAEPKLVTSSGKEATFLVGGRQAVLSGASGVNGPGAAFEEVGTDLRFLPIVLGNGKIQLDVQPRVRSVNNALGLSTSFGFVPGFDDKRVTATVEMEAGQTLVIGGLIQNETLGTTFKLPVLGDIPFLGVLFSTKGFRETEQEVVVLVTPHLVDPQSCDQLNKLLPGMETRAPDDFELFLEGILEAPRGPRKVMQNRRYTPAFKNAAPLDFESGESRVPGYPLVPSAGVEVEKKPATLPEPSAEKTTSLKKGSLEKPEYSLGKIDVVFPTPLPPSPVK